jgi:3-oxoacyl-[acyl-carrier protein] reductase
MFDLTGMTALVTGASGGIGSAIAKSLVAQGAKVALSGTREDALKAVQAEIGGETVILPCNLGDSAAVDALVPSAVDALGGQLDILATQGIFNIERGQS